MACMCLAGAVVATTVTGCNSCSDVEITEATIHGSLEHSVAQISVEGMMCEIACGGKIRKELMEVPGTANAAIDFRVDRAVNFAEVEFDPSRTSVEELVEAIREIADGKLYAVRSVDITHYKR